MKLELSVILCTRSPRPEYMRRVLDALVGQTLAPECFEVIVVDNGGGSEIVKKVSASLPNFRVIKEPRVGLTHARFAGYHEAKAELLVFVDDDNVLAPDYLEVVLAISREFPEIGVWSGRLIPEFEVGVPSWAKQRIGYLGLRDFHERSNIASFNGVSSCPVGAGMVVRRPIMQAFEQTCQRLPLHLLLGRAGTGANSSMMCAEDFDICFEASTLGFHLGLFPELSLTHLIPKERLEKEYFARLLEGYWASYCLLMLLRRPDSNLGPSSALWKRAIDTIRYWLMSPTSRRFQKSYIDGWARGRRLYIEASAARPGTASPNKKQDAA